MKTMRVRQKRLPDRKRLPVQSAVFLERHFPSTGLMALIDSEGKIVAVNKAWTSLANETGAAWKRTGPGANYLEICRQANEAAEAQKALAGIQAVLKGKAPSFTMDYPCHTPSGLAYFRTNVTPITYGQARAAVEHINITDLRRSVKTDDLKRLRQFARRLIHAQEEERQRISREMHDDLGHKIALMSFTVRQVIQQHSKNSSVRQDLSKILDGIDSFSEALRDLSHSLHPPSLKYLGIKDALRSLCKDFEKTYRIRLDLSVPAEAPRLPAEVELGVFRIAQESLQNIAKHSGASKGKIILETQDGEIRLTVVDEGRGFDPSEVTKKSRPRSAEHGRTRAEHWSSVGDRKFTRRRNRNPIKRPRSSPCVRI